VIASLEHAAYEVKAEGYILTKEKEAHTPFFTGSAQSYRRRTDWGGELPAE